MPVIAPTAALAAPANWTVARRTLMSEVGAYGWMTWRGSQRTRWLLCMVLWVCMAAGPVSAEDAETSGSPLAVPGAQTVSPAQAYALLLQGVPFIDVRNPRLHARRHIPGAHHLDLSSGFTQSALEAIVDHDKPLVIYCSGRKCRRSSRASGFAVEWGFTQVKYFRDGIVGWRDAGYSLHEAQ